MGKLLCPTEPMNDRDGVHLGLYDPKGFPLSTWLITTTLPCLPYAYPLFFGKNLFLIFLFSFSLSFSAFLFMIVLISLTFLAKNIVFIM